VSAGLRPWRRWPTAPARSGPWTRSWVPATPGSPPPKRRVFGQVGIDTPAGPSEIVVVADGLNDPAWIAADLLSQAEHDPAAQAVLITDDEAFAQRVCAEVERLSASSPPARPPAPPGATTARWSSPPGRRPGLVDRLAPEHVEFAVEDARGLAARVRHAGAIFLGRHAPEAVGDYVAGSNHVLPTSGAARFASGLSIYDFLKRTSLLGFDARGMAAWARPPRSWPTPRASPRTRCPSRVRWRRA
jgi:histidinol dehydrogenase